MTCGTWYKKPNRWQVIFFNDIVQRFCVSHTRNFLKIYYNPKNKENIYYWPRLIKIFLFSRHTWHQNYFIWELGRAFWGWTLSWPFCDNIHTEGVYIVPWVTRCFLFCFVFLSTLVLCLMRLLSLEIPFHKYYTSYYLLINQCHLHIFPLQYLSWRVSCFYVLSAYPRSYNSDHTNNTYVL